MRIKFEGKTIEGKDKEHITCKLRKEHYLTYREIAELLGVDRQSVANWLKRHDLHGRVKKPKEKVVKTGLTSMDKRRRFLAKYLSDRDWETPNNPAISR